MYFHLSCTYVTWMSVVPSLPALFSHPSVPPLCSSHVLTRCRACMSSVPLHLHQNICEKIYRFYSRFPEEPKDAT